MVPRRGLDQSRRGRSGTIAASASRSSTAGCAPACRRRRGIAFTAARQDANRRLAHPAPKESRGVTITVSTL